MSLFEIKGLTKVYGDRTVLDIPELDIEEGVIYALLGPNGSGKTTLLDILGLLIPPTKGRIRYAGREVDLGGNNLTPLRREIVMVQQNPVLFTTTVFNNLEFGLKIRGVPKREREQTVVESLDLVGMRDFIQASAHKLSGGETQRVAIARALACFPEVILLDEPTGSVDVENQIIIERIIHDINRSKGISVIFTTHNMIQATRLADETLFLYQGRAGQSIHENIFSGTIEMEANGRKTCVIQNGIRLRVSSDKTGPVRISIHPSEVEIRTGRSDAFEENTFKGTLIQVTDEHSQVRALVDVGLPMSVLIPKDVFRDFHMDMGEDIWLTCPPGSIDIF